MNLTNEQITNMVILIITIIVLFIVNSYEYKNTYATLTYVGDCSKSGRGRELCKYNLAYVADGKTYTHQVFLSGGAKVITKRIYYCVSNQSQYYNYNPFYMFNFIVIVLALFAFVGAAYIVPYAIPDTKPVSTVTYKNPNAFISPRPTTGPTTSQVTKPVNTIKK
jgi:hypothetical protein